MSARAALASDMMTPSEITARNQLASDWMHRGMDLATEGAHEKAIRCFDEAIALRKTLPLDENPQHRYGLSAGWINRGDALASLGKRDETIQSYDEALALLKTLPLEENILYPRRLAITWINRGTALQQIQTGDASREACLSFREAIAVLETPSSSSMTDRTNLLAGAWSNLANTLFTGELATESEIRTVAQTALDLLKPLEQTDLRAAQCAFATRLLLCRIAVKEILASKTLSTEASQQSTDAAEEGLDLASHWKFHDDPRLAPQARELFHFGCRIYENAHPQFLAEFINEYLPDSFDSKTVDAVRATIWGVINRMQNYGLHQLATPEALVQIEALRKIEQRLLSTASQR